MKYYDWKGMFFDGFAEVHLNYKYGYINEKGEEICEIKYDSIGYFYAGFAHVSIKFKHGYINDKGIEVVPCEYGYGEA